MNMARAVTAHFFLLAAMPFGISHAATCLELAGQYTQKAFQCASEKNSIDEAYSRCIEQSNQKAGSQIVEIVDKANCDRERAAGNATVFVMKQELEAIDSTMKSQNCSHVAQTSCTK